MKIDGNFGKYNLPKHIIKIYCIINIFILFRIILIYNI
jgi:hypothetical protein